MEKASTRYLAWVGWLALLAGGVFYVVIRQASEGTDSTQCQRSEGDLANDYCER